MHVGVGLCLQLYIHDTHEHLIPGYTTLVYIRSLIPRSFSGYKTRPSMHGLTTSDFPTYMYIYICTCSTVRVFENYMYMYYMYISVHIKYSSAIQSLNPTCISTFVCSLNSTRIISVETSFNNEDCVSRMGPDAKSWEASGPSCMNVHVHKSTVGHIILT